MSLRTLCFQDCLRIRNHSKLFPSLIYSKIKAESKHNHYKILLKYANFSQDELSTTYNFPEHMQLADNKVFIISLDIPYIKYFPTGQPLLPPKPTVWKYCVRPVTVSVVLYLAITVDSNFLSLAFHCFWSHTRGKKVAHLYLLITLKELNAVNIVFPHVPILPSQTKHQVKKAMVHIKFHV
jgi:hypothetical protein